MLRDLLMTRHLTYFQAAFYGSFAYFMFSISDVMGKFLMAEGYDKSIILVLNSVPSLIALTLLMIKRHGIKNALHTRYPTYHVGRCIALIGVTFFVFEAIDKLPLTDFYGITFSTPFFITIGAFFIFKEKTNLVEWLAIIIGFIGVLIVVNPDFNNFNMGYAYAIASVICITFAALVIRKIGRDEDPYLFVIFSNIGIILANIIPAIETAMPDIITMWHIVIFTIYSFTIPTAILTMSAVFARAPSITAVAPFQYLQIVWGVLFGYIIFNDVPQMNTIIGSLIVIGCGLFVLFHHKRKIK